jgi:hypothetical protein
MRTDETLVQTTSLETFLDLIEERTPFSFSRWNDGQWNMILGKTEGSTGDGHKYSKVIGDDLRAVLLDRPKYMLGLQGLSCASLRTGMADRFGKLVKNWIHDNGIENLTWFDADIFALASVENKLDPIIQALSGREVVVVGPKHMKKLPFASHFVPIPKTDTYYEKRRIIEQIEGILGDLEPSVIALSAGWTANLIIAEMHPTFGDKHTFIDFGSVWDPYVGVFSRMYMKKDSFKNSFNSRSFLR